MLYQLGPNQQGTLVKWVKWCLWTKYGPHRNHCMGARNYSKWLNLCFLRPWETNGTHLPMDVEACSPAQPNESVFWQSEMPKRPSSFLTGAAGCSWVLHGAPSVTLHPGCQKENVTAVYHGHGHAGMIILLRFLVDAATKTFTAVHEIPDILQAGWWSSHLQQGRCRFLNGMGNSAQLMWWGGGMQPGLGSQPTANWLTPSTASMTKRLSETNPLNWVALKCSFSIFLNPWAFPQQIDAVALLAFRTGDQAADKPLKFGQTSS